MYTYVHRSVKLGTICDNNTEMTGELLIPSHVPAAEGFTVIRHGKGTMSVLVIGGL